MVVIQILMGIVLLAAGRRRFWFFVGAMGFIIGATVAPLIFPGQSQWVLLAVAVVGGLIGALLAIFLQQLAIGLAGFIAGGYGVVSILSLLHLTLPVWIPYLVGGIIGVVLVAMLFDWALIILSSFSGASLLVQTVDLSLWLGLLALVFLFAVGIAIQSRDVNHPIRRRGRS